jgi:hypothetical protein
MDTSPCANSGDANANADMAKRKIRRVGWAMRFTPFFGSIRQRDKALQSTVREAQGGLQNGKSQQLQIAAATLRYNRATLS